MPHDTLHSVLHYLRRLAPAHEPADEGDVQLLRRFSAEGDEAAFAALVRRHGPMVWAVCARMLPQASDAEDAFQATFLVLCRKAGGLRGPDRLGPWLHGVACRTAAKARLRAARRLAREKAVARALAAESTPEVVWREVRGVLDEEVSRLPEHYRAPFLLCYLEGLTNEEAARRLCCPKGTVLSRLARARERLRLRLARRGLALSGSALALALAQSAGGAAAPAALLEATANTLPRLAAGATLSASVTTLAEGVTHAMLLAKLKLAAVGLLALGLAGTAAGFLARPRFKPASLLTAPPAARAAAQKGKGAADKPARPAEKAADSGRAGELRAALRAPVDFPGLKDPKLTLGEALEHLADRYKVTFDVNEPVFKSEGVEDVLSTRVVDPHPIPAMKAPLEVVLRKLLSRVPAQSGATYLIRKGGIEVTTHRAVRVEIEFDRRGPLDEAPPEQEPPLPALIWEEFEDVPLAMALRRLADASGFSVVLDVRASDKGKIAITARLTNVPVDTAVRLLADMTGLDAVRLDNVFYVTSPENARRLRRPAPDPTKIIPGLGLGGLGIGGLGIGGGAGGGAGAGVGKPASGAK
jgi:RNA polymerase sigma factor (sigma-70 family)